jgi:hypothetical protein
MFPLEIHVPVRSLLLVIIHTRTLLLCRFVITVSIEEVDELSFLVTVEGVDELRLVAMVSIEAAGLVVCDGDPTM